MYRKLTTVAAVAALTLGLAACGGGGSSPTTSNQNQDQNQQDDTMSDVVMSESVSLPANIPAGHEPMAGEMTIAAGESYTSGGVVLGCAAGGPDCVVTVADDGTVSSTGGTVTAALTDAAQMAQETAALAMRDRLISLDTAIEGATNVPTGTTAGTLDEGDIRITRGPGAAARVRVTDPTGFVPSDGTLLPNGDDWAGTRLMRAVGPATQHLVVYTDIGAPTKVPFYNFDGDATTPRLYADTALVAGSTGFDATPPADSSATVPPLALTSGTNFFTGAVLDPTKFDGPGPEGDGDQRQLFRGSATGAGPATPGTSFRGNYNGAPGTYTCVAPAGTNNCVVVIPETGPYTSTGTWSFTPEFNAEAWRGDGEFMSFGWWLHEPNNPNRAHTFQYYVDGTAYTTIAAGTPTGTATYTGRAAGQYVVQTVDDSGVTGGMAGQFTAAASLTANFDAVTGGGTAAPTIQGTISGFQGEGMSMPGWEVTLHRKALTNLAGDFRTNSTAQPDPTLPNYNGVTAAMDDQTAYGGWTGQFFGNAMRTDATGTRVPVANARPLGVGGTFQADNDAVSIAGAFGARR